MKGPFKWIKEEWRDRKALNRARKLLDEESEGLERPETFCFFVGYPRSGHSLVGSLIDAHPDAALAHEQDALKYVHKGLGREELFALLLDNSRRTGRKGRSQTGYSYVVAGQYQGRERELKVIGDKRGGNSSRWLRDRPQLLEHLQHMLYEKLRIVHISRNPFDNIATMAYRHAKGRSERMSEAVLRQEKANYMSLARTVEETRSRVRKEELHPLALEDLLRDPGTELPKLLDFLDLEKEEAHLEACCELLYSEPSRSRDRFHWPEDLVEEVLTEIRGMPFLAPYSQDRP